MSILSGKVKEKSMFVGAHISSHTHYYLTLFCIARDTSKAKLIKELLDSWKTREEEEIELIKDIVSRIDQQCMIKKKIDPTITSDRFIVEVTRELQAKGLKQSAIETILKKIHIPWKEQKSPNSH